MWRRCHAFRTIRTWAVPVAGRDDVPRTCRAGAGTDHHLPAARTAPRAARQRFSEAGPGDPRLPATGGSPTRPPPRGRAGAPGAARRRPARAADPRTDHLRDHAGQISFPGGRSEPEDADARPPRCARREEEVGLARRRVEVIGRLPVYTTVTHFVVTPVVALVQPPFELTLDAFEVAEAFEVPLAFLMTRRTTAATSSPIDGGSASSCRCPGRARRRWTDSRVLHLGCHRGHAAQPVRLPAR
jgi:8-oxo-dGTP pyrophosphatase MutT (NUDIX family)